MLTKREVIDILKKEQAVLKSRFGVKKAAIFGSFATDTACEKSDVDIFLEFDKPVGLRFIQLCDYLDNKLGKKADILTPGGLAGIRVERVRESIKKDMLDV